MLRHTARTELTSCFDVAAAEGYPYTGRVGILSYVDRQKALDALRVVGAEELEDPDFARLSDRLRQYVHAGPRGLPKTVDFAYGPDNVVSGRKGQGGPHGNLESAGTLKKCERHRNIT